MPSHIELANAIRFLSLDAVERAGCGHPGMPMGMADIAEVLWNHFLKHNPNNPNWFNRDRFVISNGHGSMLLYSLLHLAGYDLSIDELKNFRQLGSKTPGHPEHGDTPGVETTTGPLAQGLANAVGMALAEKILATDFNSDDYNIVDHFTYAFAGDGCLMEGLSHEVCSLAGTLKLGKLIVFWDDNEISIDGATKQWFTTDVPEKFRAYGWHVISEIDGHNADLIHGAIELARAKTGQPTLICCQTKIGHGSPTYAGTAKIHGNAMGEKEIEKTRKALNWNHAPFEIPEDMYAAYDAKTKGQAVEAEWGELFEAYKKSHPKLADLFASRLQKKLPADWHDTMKNLLEQSQKDMTSMATRKCSGAVLDVIGPKLSFLFGGSADLTGSNNTLFKGAKVIDGEEFAGVQYMQYGVREFGMGAMMNGLALHGGFLPYGGTFLVFQSYMAAATRMSALMKLPVVYVLTHDSIGLGEDGPTHQPVMETATLRMTPNMTVWRPCDQAETVVAWQHSIENQNGPASLLLTRQTLAAQARTNEQLHNIKRGGYILLDSKAEPEVILIATGSEVSLAMDAAKHCIGDGVQVRVVSMPSCEVFLAQDETYRESVLPNQVRHRIVIEASASAYWHQFSGLDGRVIGVDRFGISAPAKDVFQAFGFTVEHIVSEIEMMLEKA